MSRDIRILGVYSQILFMYRKVIQYLQEVTTLYVIVQIFKCVTIRHNFIAMLARKHLNIKTIEICTCFLYV